MSNYLAIAAVSKALKGLLGHNKPPEVKIVIGKPTATLGDGEQLPGANIFLFQVTPNAALLNASVPTRRADGAPAQRPQSALILHYLISVWGTGEEDEKELKAQNVLAAVIRKLNAQPELTRKNIEDTLVMDGTVSSNLADQVERVRFTMKTLSLEDLSKLWSVMFQTPYFLSVVYEASVVLIEADEPPLQSFPVLERNLYVKTFREPVIERVSAKTGTQDPITDGTTIRITGRMLKGDVTRVLVDGDMMQPVSVHVVSDREIECVLPAGSLNAGMHGLQVSNEILMGKYDPANAIDKRTPHRGTESLVSVFVLSPLIVPGNIHHAPNAAVPADTDVTISAIAPVIGKRQRVVLLLNELQPVSPPAPEPPPAKAYSFSRRDSAPGDPDETGTVVFETKGIVPGTYLLRLQVDGAATALDIDPATGQFIGPTITIP